MKKISLVLCLQLLCLTICCQSAVSVGPLPAAAQLKWQDNNFCLFGHFGPNTFTERIRTFPVQAFTQIGIRITDAKTDPLISEAGAYHIDERLVEK